MIFFNPQKVYIAGHSKSNELQMTQDPLISLDLVRSVERAEKAYILSRLESLLDYRDNILGVKIKEFGKVLAIAVRQWPNYWYGNMVIHVDNTLNQYLGEIENLFKQEGLKHRIVTYPSSYSKEVGKVLVASRYYPAFFSAAVYTQDPILDYDPSIPVRNVKKDEIDQFLDYYQTAFGYPLYNEIEKEAHIYWLTTQLENNHMNLYYATIDDTVAGTATMYVNNNTAIMADAATLPQFRNLGVQHSLLHTRLSDAKARKVALYTSYVEFLSASHRNLSRFGFNVACNYITWYKHE